MEWRPRIIRRCDHKPIERIGGGYRGDFVDDNRSRQAAAGAPSADVKWISELVPPVAVAYINVPDSGQAKLKEKLPLLSVVALDPSCVAVMPALHKDIVAPAAGTWPAVAVPLMVAPFNEEVPLLLPPPQAAAR